MRGNLSHRVGYRIIVYNFLTTASNKPVSKTNQCFDSQLDKKKFGRVRVPQYYGSHHTDILRKKLLIMKEVWLNILQNQINTVVSVYWRNHDT